MRSATQTSPKFGLLTTTALVVGNMVGSGIFLLPTILAQYGPISVLGWIVTTLGAIFLCLVFAQLSKLLPYTGGPYVYTRHALGDLIGFLVAWGYWIGVWSGNAAIALTSISYLSVFIPVLAKPSYAIMTAISLIWALTWINTRSIKFIAEVEIIATILKLLPLLFVGTVGWFFIHSSYYIPFNPTGHSHLSVITSVAALTLWAFIGIESATIPAGNIKNPEKTIPRATLLGTLLTAGVYLASTMAIMGLVPPETLKTSAAPFAAATFPILGNITYYVFAACAAIACLGTLNGWILIQGQVPMAAAHDKLFPAIFGRLNRAQLPTQGIIISSVLVSVLIFMNFSKSLVSLYTFSILLATFTTLIPYILCVISLPIIFWRQKKPIAKKQFFAILFIALLAFAYVIWPTYGVGKTVAFYGSLLLLLGVPIYFWQKRSNRN